MSSLSKKEHLAVVARRYKKATRQEKSKIRQWIGYQRFDVIQIVDLLNDLYKNE